MKGVHAYANQGPLENLTTQFLFSEMATYSFTETEHKIQNTYHHVQFIS